MALGVGTQQGHHARTARRAILSHSHLRTSRRTRQFLGRPSGQPVGRNVATKKLDGGPFRSFKIPRHDAKERTDEGRFFAA